MTEVKAMLIITGMALLGIAVGGAVAIVISANFYLGVGNMFLVEIGCFILFWSICTRLGIALVRSLDRRSQA